jgi:hypothetical protein
MTRLESGDWLLIFTGGLVEAENAKQDEYGEPDGRWIASRGGLRPYPDRSFETRRSMTT